MKGYLRTLGFWLLTLFIGLMACVALWFTIETCIDLLKSWGIDPFDPLVMLLSIGAITLLVVVIISSVQFIYSKCKVRPDAEDDIYTPELFGIEPKK